MRADGSTMSTQVQRFHCRQSSQLDCIFYLLPLCRQKVSFDGKFRHNLFYVEFIVDNLLHICNGQILWVPTEWTQANGGSTLRGSDAFQGLNELHAVVHARKGTPSNSGTSTRPKEPTKEKRDDKGKGGMGQLEES